MVPAPKSCIMNGFGGRWESSESMRWDREERAGGSWRHAVGDNGHGREGLSRIGSWEKPDWKATSCSGLVSLLRSSENGMVCLQSLNGGEECGSLSCRPGKGGQVQGRITVSNNSKGLPPALLYITCLLQKWSPSPLMICPHEVHMWRKGLPRLTLE